MKFGRQLYRIHRSLLYVMMFSVPLYVYWAVSRDITVINEDQQTIAENQRQNSSAELPPTKREKQSCVLPTLQLWKDEIRGMFRALKPVNCSQHEQNWVYVDNGTFHISQSAAARHGAVNCTYTPIRGGDEPQHGEPIQPIKDGTRVTADVFDVVCTAADGSNYTNVHSAVVPTPEILSRSERQSKRLTTAAMKLNVLMFGFDSVSRLTWMRMLPLTYKYLVEQLGAVVLQGYNIVGDGTPQALLPILTGKTEIELPEARRGFAGAQPLDDHPWLWKELADVGYVTQWGEDGTNTGTFHLRMLGFRRQPVDHYIRTYYLVTEPHNIPRKYCTGSVARHVIMMRHMRDFLDAYPSRLRFSFAFHTEYSHFDNNLLQLADKDMLAHLRHLYDGGYLNRSLLMLLSDHGARFHYTRTIEQGKYEERMPFVAVRLPSWFAAQYPEAAANLRQNSQRLTTPFDLHETLKDVIDFDRRRRSKTTSASSGRYPRGYSLFQAIPADRTCAEADIEPHWCTCLDWKSMPVTSVEVRRAVEHVVNLINNMTSQRVELCATLSVSDVISAVRYVTRDEVLRFRKASDPDGRVADLSDEMSNTVELYQVTFKTAPSDAMYEATVKRYLTSNVYDVTSNDISRTNRYGSQPHCVATELPNLRQFCYCRQQLQYHGNG